MLPKNFITNIPYHMHIYVSKLEAKNVKKKKILRILCNMDFWLKGHKK